MEENNKFLGEWIQTSHIVANTSNSILSLCVPEIIRLYETDKKFIQFIIKFDKEKIKQIQQIINKKKIKIYETNKN